MDAATADELGTACPVIGSLALEPVLGHSAVSALQCTSVMSGLLPSGCRQRGGKHPIRCRSAAGGDDVDPADSSESENEQSVDAEADDETAVSTNPNKLHLALWRVSMATIMQRRRLHVCTYSGTKS